MITVTLSQWGLIVDIIGAILLFTFFPTKHINTDGKHLIAEPLEGEDLKRAIRINRRNEIWGKAGLFLLMAGFVLQFIGSIK